MSSTLSEHRSGTSMAGEHAFLAVLGAVSVGALHRADGRASPTDALFQWLAVGVHARVLWFVFDHSTRYGADRSYGTRVGVANVATRKFRIALLHALLSAMASAPFVLVASPSRARMAFASGMALVIAPRVLREVWRDDAVAFPATPREFGAAMSASDALATDDYDVAFVQGLFMETQTGASWQDVFGKTREEVIDEGIDAPDAQTRETLERIVRRLTHTRVKRADATRLACAAVAACASFVALPVVDVGRSGLTSRRARLGVVLLSLALLDSLLRSSPMSTSAPRMSYDTGMQVLVAITCALFAVVGATGIASRGKMKLCAALALGSLAVVHASADDRLAASRRGDTPALLLVVALIAGAVAGKHDSDEERTVQFSDTITFIQDKERHEMPRANPVLLVASSSFTGEDEDLPEHVDRLHDHGATIPIDVTSGPSVRHMLPFDFSDALDATYEAPGQAQDTDASSTTLPSAAPGASTVLLASPSVAMQHAETPVRDITTVPTPSEASATRDAPTIASATDDRDGSAIAMWQPKTGVGLPFEAKPVPPL